MYEKDGQTYQSSAKERLQGETWEQEKDRANELIRLQQSCREMEVVWLQVLMRDSILESKGKKIPR